MYRSMFYYPRHYLNVDGQLHAPAALPPGKDPLVTHWVGLRAALDDVEKRKFLILPGLELPTPRPSSP
jgi:hypothetical protein